MGGWTTLCRADEIAEGRNRSFGEVTVFRVDGRYHACGSRCPHMGYPMSKGVIRDGVLTCAWHKWEFDLDTGGCYRGACDDLPVYPCEVADGEVRVRLDGGGLARDEEERRLREGMQVGDIYLEAKAIARLLHLGATGDEIAATAAAQAFRHATINHRSLQAGRELGAILAGATLAGWCDARQRVTALLQGARAGGGSSGDRPAIVPLPGALEPARAAGRLEAYVDDSSQLGVERLLRSWPEGDEAGRDAAIVRAVTDARFFDARDHPIAIARILAARGRFPGYDDLWQAPAAWILGLPRNDLQPDARDARAWIEEREDELATTPCPADGDAAARPEDLIAALDAGPVERTFDWLRERLAAGDGFCGLLGTFALFFARRLDHLRPNNGGLWNSAIRGLRLCDAIRQMSAHLDDRGRVQALLLLAFDAFVSRWLHPGKVTAARPSAEADWRGYGEAFAANDLDGARRLAVDAATAGMDRAAFLAPLLAEDLALDQIDTLLAALREAEHQPEWQPFLASMVTYVMDLKGQQNVRAAARFGASFVDA